MAPKAGWLTRGKALDNVEPMKGCSPAAPNRRPEVLKVDPSAEGLGARLLLEWGAGDDEEEEEEDEEEEEEAAGEEVRAADRVGAGEASRSPDSILLEMSSAL